MGELALADIITQGYMDAAGDDWQSLGRVSKAIRRTITDFLTECRQKEMEKAGGIEEIFKRHETEIGKANRERRRACRKAKKGGEEA